MAENIIEKMERIEREIKEIQTKKDKATGRYEAAVGALNALGYKTIEEAVADIAVKEEQIAVRQARLDTDYDAFYKKYEEVFADD